jgi:ectoine hydroxylase-related dioxygenase (phytanoyl-CoA dioxygenase family)
MVLTNYIDEFQNQGYTIVENFWPPELLNAWENSIILFYLRQAIKIKSLKEKLAPLVRTKLTVNELDTILLSLENDYKEAAYQVIKMVEGSLAAHQMMSFNKLIDMASSLLNCPSNLLTMAGINPFINLPSTKRLLYKWHTEGCYYPKRRNFLNIWFPIFRDKNIKNGTMWFCKKSHTIAERHFIEYQGYDKETENKKNHFIQYEIPESELTEYEKIPVIAKRGDIVFFHRSMVHAGTVISSATASYASVMRIFDYGNDLTLSGDYATQPYKDQGGLSELIPLQSAIFFRDKQLDNPVPKENVL